MNRPGPFTYEIIRLIPIHPCMLNTTENNLISVVNILNTVVYQALYQLFILTEYAEIIRWTERIICLTRNEGLD